MSRGHYILTSWHLCCMEVAAFSVADVASPLGKTGSVQGAHADADRLLTLTYFATEADLSHGRNMPRSACSGPGGAGCHIPDRLEQCGV